jgi:hypothetical protein
MHRLKWLLWLSAWAVWIWLGVGLYRELPRKYGKPIGRINFHSDAMLLGFLGASSHFAVIRESKESHTTVEVIDLETDRLVGSAPGPRKSDYLTGSSGDSNIEFIAARTAPNANGALRTSGFFLLDLNCWEWRRPSNRIARSFTLHENKPRMLFVDDDLSGGPTIVVMDFESGKELFARKLPERTFVYGPPRFIPNSDCLFISTSTDPGERDDDSAKCL